MKSAFLAAVLALLSSTDGFVANAPVRTTSASRAGSAMQMSSEPQTREAALKQGLAGVLSVAGIAALSSQPASAGGLSPVSNGDKWAGVLDPRSAVKDSDKMASESVKKNLAALKKYQSVTKDLTATLAKDTQADVLPTIKETFKFAEFRQVLNELNDVFDEDTQRGTDLIIRNMLQDALELANASKMKPDIPRSERKVEILNKKLQKLDQAFVSLNEFL